MPSRLHLLGLAIIAALACAAPVGAQQILGGGGASPAVVSLHSGWGEPDGRRIAGLRMALAPGWKTYWRAPGAAGIPPHFDWSGSRNVRNVNIVWPRPAVFESFGMRTIGYKEEMVLPLAITAEDADRPIRLRLALSYGVCEEICVPATADLALDIAPGQSPDGAELITAAIASAPQRATRGGLTSATCALRPDEKRFEARLAFEPTLPEGAVVVAEGENAMFGPLESRFENGSLIAVGEMRALSGGIDRSALRLTVLTPEAAWVVEGCPSG